MQDWIFNLAFAGFQEAHYCKKALSSCGEYDSIYFDTVMQITLVKRLVLHLDE